MNYKRKRRFLSSIFIFILLLFYLFQNFSDFIRIFGLLFGFITFYSIDHLFKIEFKLRHYCMFIIMLFLGVFLAPLYGIYEFYDKVVHFINPILGSFLVFYIIDRKNLEFQWKLLITFMFIISFLAIHEIAEYLLDLVWNFKLQGVYIREITNIGKLNLVVSQIDDTMMDMIIGFLGTTTFMVGKTVSFFYNQRKLKK